MSEAKKGRTGGRASGVVARGVFFGGRGQRGGALAPLPLPLLLSLFPLPSLSLDKHTKSGRHETRPLDRPAHALVVARPSLFPTTRHLAAHAHTGDRKPNKPHPPFAPTRFSPFSRCGCGAGAQAAHIRTYAHRDLPRRARSKNAGGGAAGAFVGVPNEKDRALAVAGAAAAGGAPATVLRERGEGRPQGARQLIIPFLIPLPPKNKPPQIFIGNFEYEAQERDIVRLFERYGPVEKIDMKSGASSFVAAVVTVGLTSQDALSLSICRGISLSSARPVTSPKPLTSQLEIISIIRAYPPKTNQHRSPSSSPLAQSNKNACAARARHRRCRPPMII